MSPHESSVPDRCPLCLSAKIEEFCRDKQRAYWRCDVCCLVYVPPNYHLSRDAEQAVYDHHQNSPQDERYRKFLSRLFLPVQQQIKPGSSGLDFGSGPGPTLSVMFEEAGHTMAIYDPLYAPDPSPLTEKYDFVTCSEVVEHFQKPREDLNRLWACVNPGGVLGIMTKRAGDLAAFKNWHYKNDPTHISFFSDRTFVWITNEWNAELEIVSDDVVLIVRAE